MRTIWLLIGLAFSITACGGGSIDTNEWSLEGLAPDDQHLLVSTRFGGVASGCTRFEGWEVAESAEAVEITASLWRKRAPSDCTDDGAQEVHQIDLDAPLGDRRLTGCGVDDCRATVSAGGDHFVGPVIATTSALAVTDGSAIAVYTNEGELVSAITGNHSGEIFALPDDVVVYNDDFDTVAVALGTGEELWRNVGWLNTTTDDAVYVCRGQDSDGLAAIDAATGEDLWATDRVCESLIVHGELLTIVGYDRNVDGGHLLQIVDAATGKLLSSEPIDDGFDDQVGGFERAISVGSTTIAAGPQANLVVLGADGTELARQPSGLGYPMGAADGIVVLGTEGVAVGFDPNTMSEAWRIEGNAFTTLSVADGSIWSLDRAAGTVSRRDPSSGRATWTTPVGMTSGFDVASGGDAAYIVTTQAVIAVDNNNGEILWAQHRPYTGAS